MSDRHDDLGENNLLAISQIISQWTVKLGGRERDTPIDEFLFRVESLATADNVPAENLVDGLHHLLSDNAKDFYWVQRRKYPNDDWNQIRNLFRSHFARQENDFELRNLIMNFRQGADEEFSEFSLGIERLAARLAQPMADEELVQILRENMTARLQNSLLLVATPTVEELKRVCRQYEGLWFNGFRQ